MDSSVALSISHACARPLIVPRMHAQRAVQPVEQCVADGVEAVVIRIEAAELAPRPGERPSVQPRTAAVLVRATRVEALIGRFEQPVLDTGVAESAVPRSDLIARIAEREGWRSGPAAAL